MTLDGYHLYLVTESGATRQNFLDLVEAKLTRTKRDYKRGTIGREEAVQSVDAWVSLTGMQRDADQLVEAWET